MSSLKSLGKEYRDFDKKVGKSSITITMLVSANSMTSTTCHSRSVGSAKVGNCQLPSASQFAFKYLKNEIDGLALECIFTDVSVYLSVGHPPHLVSSVTLTGSCCPTFR